MGTPEENARLEPLVWAAIALQRSSPAPRREVPPSQTPGRFTLEDYVAGAMADVEAASAFDPGAEASVVAKLQAAGGGRFSDDDCRQAMALASDLLSSALLAESSHGDCPEAEEDLRQESPGFSKGLYAELIGWFGYVNR